jgi:hypothetical protein
MQVSMHWYDDVGPSLVDGVDDADGAGGGLVFDEELDDALAAGAGFFVLGSFASVVRSLPLVSTPVGDAAQAKSDAPPVARTRTMSEREAWFVISDSRAPPTHEPVCRHQTTRPPYDPS